MLSDDIFSRTETRLSVTTLKRVWGRIKYQSSPSTTTLNALAKYAGYADWRNFELEINTVQADLPSLIATKKPITAVPAANKNKRWYLTVGALLILLALAWLLATSSDSPPFNLATSPAPASAAPLSLSNVPAIIADDYTFTSEKIKTEGVPNAVVFRYDATMAGADYPVRISQSWDTARSVVVSAYDSVHSSQYFYPGFFNAKLLVGNQVVQSHNLHITAPDWVGAIHRPGTPVYLAPESFRDHDTLVVNEQMLQQYNVQLEPSLPEVRLYRVPDLPTIRSDDFSFETTLRSDYNSGSGACQAINVLLLLKNDAIIVPLRATGCTGNVSVFALGTEMNAGSTDLSGFGTNLSNWTRLGIEGRDRQLRFLVNNQPALTMTVDVDPNDIIGVSIRLQGPGRVRETFLRGSGYVVEL
jgi:hypothetical protein